MSMFLNHHEKAQVQQIVVIYISLILKPLISGMMFGIEVSGCQHLHILSNTDIFLALGSHYGYV